MSEREWAPLDAVLPDIRKALDGSRVIGCLAHKDADADSLGSSLAFADSLRAAGKTVYPMVPSPPPLLLRYLPGFDTISDVPENLDLLATFDCASLGRFGDKRSVVEHAQVVINVDHHATNEAFGSINLIDPRASATGQVVYALLRALDLPITPAGATNMYAALLTDTGGFRHENTTEAALRLGADLVALGADPGWIALKSYKSRSVGQVRLEGLAVARMRTELNGHLIWSEITNEMVREAAATMQESEGVIDQLQSIDTMKIAILLKEVGPNHTKISVRSRDEYDATDVCTPFGGGGHHRAAGAELMDPIDVAQSKVLAVARELLSHAP